MKKNLPWLGAGLIIVIIFGSLYAAMQQFQRAEANNVGIQLASDASRALDDNTVPFNYNKNKVDLETSIAPFIIIYDKRTGTPIAGNGYLDGSLAMIPYGVLTASKDKPYNAVTWAPKSNVRIASVSVEGKKYYVTAGKSLKRVEADTNLALEIALIGCLMSLVTLAVIYLFAK